ncbi:TetR/AcrR family transcriptional regulator [Actibacterium ureilyticum]|uniref:TetR/AcrR family transcriptional regulator n=1 Tax=Actibacterium ureilyticum TaxID=1590614 RepID=UPI000BAABD81|nr:TetR/AcrR family transcriptional regulator [Actibacterium ureilyticum]
MNRPIDTRTRIMDVAEAAVLAKGFEATSIEEIVAATGITKGGFFYHFPDKNALGQALLERYIVAEDALLADIGDKARALTDDPLQMMLVYMKLLADLIADMPNGHPGCLIAAAVYQERLFSPEVRALNRDALLRWRGLFLDMLQAIEAEYPKRDDVPLEHVADMVSAVVDGGIILSKALSEPKATSQQVLLYRSYVKLLFTPPRA